MYEVPKVNLSESSLKIREQTTKLFSLYSRDRSNRTRNKIVELNAGMVHRTARKYSQQVNKNVTPLEELEQLGFIGLIKAIERFDVSKDGAFVSYAGLYIEGEMMHHNRSVKGLIKVPVTLVETHSKVLKIQRIIQKKRPSENVTIEYVLNSSPQLGLTMDKWREIEAASKTQHYAPIDCRVDDDSPFIQVPDDEQNTLDIAADTELKEERLAIMERRMLYALERQERIIFDELLQGVKEATVATRHNLSLSEVNRIKNISIAKLQTCS